MAPVNLQGKPGKQGKEDHNSSFRDEWCGINCATALAAVLERSACAGDFADAAPTRFDATQAPKISLKEYAARIAKYAGVTEECFVLSLVYIDRLVQQNPGFVITNLNAHRLLITSIVVAAKFQDDDYYSNEYFARVGGVSTEELMGLETHLLSLLAWNAHVSKEDYYHGLNWFLFWSGIGEAPIEKVADFESALQKSDKQLYSAESHLGWLVRGVQSCQGRRPKAVDQPSCRGRTVDASKACGRRRCDVSWQAQPKKRCLSPENARHFGFEKW
mmetsp:Transcript_165534/g.293157  ORF Transcript_165534/g.293157 Transcript_165534/m.293157 type:complete len:274 (+) Transcript_165534:65-886(+)